MTFLISLLISMVFMYSIEAKYSRCKDVLNKNDQNFFYCTKFTAGKGQAFQSHFKAKFSRNMEYTADKWADPGFKDAKSVQIAVAIYTFNGWQ